MRRVWLYRADRIALAVALTFGVAGGALGCRTVWVHPEATAEKYQKDTFFCKYGIEQSEWAASAEADPEPDAGAKADVKTEAQRMVDASGDRSWALGVEPGRPIDREWKKCMTRLGWRSVTSSRQEREFRTTVIPPGGVGKRGRR